MLCWDGPQIKRSTPLMAEQPKAMTLVLMLSSGLYCRQLNLPRMVMPRNQEIEEKNHRHYPTVQIELVAEFFLYSPSPPPPAQALRIFSGSRRLTEVSITP